MSLEKILEKINKEYESKIIEIEKVCQNKVKEIEDNYEQEILNFKEGILNRTKEEINDYEKQKKLDASLYRKNILLKEKQNIINDVFEKVKEKIITLDKDKYLFLIKHMIYSHINELKNGEIDIFVSGDDKGKITDEFVATVNNEMKNKDIFFKLNPEYKKISGGIILKKGDIEINESWDMLFRLWKKELEMEVLKIMFDK